MIDTRDVIRMRIPYPGIRDELAVSSHMYICKLAGNPKCEFVKCQTLKPYMLTYPVLSHYVDEEADITRNPFERATRIDCDKIFITEGVQYDDKLKTTKRPDVCQELYDQIITELDKDGYNEIPLDKNALASINSLITKI